LVSKLPRWVEVGALALALIAGCVNAVGLLGFEHQSVSHLSGTATALGAGLLNSSLLTSFHLFGVLITFFLGATFAGFLLRGNALKLGRHYDTALVIEACLLGAAMLFLDAGSYYGHFFASAACGLQNALATTYSGAVVRTTHVTGIFTDLGIMLGEALRGQKMDARKAALFLTIIAGFILGGIIGAGLYARYQFAALLFPSIVCLLMAFVYRVYRRRKQNVESA